MLYLDYKKSIPSNDIKFWSNEASFWSSYGKIYRYLEGAIPYKKMLDEILVILSNKNHARWLDAGCGPGTMIDFLIKNNIKYNSILGLDFDGVMIDQAKFRLSHLDNIEIKSADLSETLPYPNDYFDGIIANLVLSYVVIFNGKYVGDEALIAVLNEMYRLLSNGGTLLWTTPVDNVNFTKVFTASWKQVINPFAPYMYYGPRILSYALQIQNKGKKGIYHFLPSDKIYNIMEDIGFKEVIIKKTFANQAYVISGTK